MRFRVTLALWFLLFVAAAFGGQPTAEPTITAVPFPPTDKPGPGTVMVIDTSGLEPDQEARVHWLPEVEGDLILDLDKDELPPFLFAGTTAGSRSLALQVKMPGWDLFIPCTFDYGGGPNPPPPPPSPIAHMTVVVVEESDTNAPHGRTAQQAAVLFHAPTLKWLRENGHRMRLVDKDETAPDVRPYVDQAMAAGIPHVFFLDSSAGEPIRYEGPLMRKDETAETFLELLKEYGAEK